MLHKQQPAQMNDDRSFWGISHARDANQSADKTAAQAQQQWGQLSWAVIMIHWTALFKEWQCLAQEDRSGFLLRGFSASQVPDSASLYRWWCWKCHSAGELSSDWWGGQWDFCLFRSQVQITGRLMIQSWLRVISAEHSVLLHSF